ncbi:MAG: hypothetical protein WA755_18030 [Candidatus Acidiferrales bacterium]
MKTVALLMVTLLISNNFAFAGQAEPAPAAPQAQTPGTSQSKKMKDQVQKRGVGEQSRVKVTLASGSVVRGTITKIEDASFAVTDKMTSQTTTISYSDVQKIQGPGMSRGAKIGISVAIVVVAATVVAVVIAVKIRNSI